VREGKRQSVFRSYTFPVMDQPNLTVLTHALVTRLTFEGKRATGVEMVYDGKTQRVGARLEVVLSLGAIQTPRVLMQSGIGDQAELQRLGIPIVQHLPGVGQNFQDHAALGCIWEHQEAQPPRNNLPGQPSSGRARLKWRARTCRRARLKFSCRVLRMLHGSACRKSGGPYSVASSGPKAEAVSV
jgi:choline dehydrogenase-like flavoprotein